MQWLINKQAVHQAALDIAARTRAQPFERVSRQFLERINGNVRAMIAREIEALPSKGKTIK